jgi:hypothetical protein
MGCGCRASERASGAGWQAGEKWISRLTCRPSRVTVDLCGVVLCLVDDIDLFVE